MSLQLNDDALWMQRYVHFVRCDITNDAEIEKAVKEIVEELGHTSFLVNNAVNFIFN
ncbi:MAG TPA: SDR family NAD(P)-dependent oxidoreductase [Chitinophagaceae bacterium]